MNFRLELLILSIFSLLVMSCNSNDTPPYEKRCTITFDANGGMLDSGSKPTIIVDYDSRFGEIPNIEKQIAKKDDPVFNFMGWGLSQHTTDKIDNDYKIRNDLTVFAIFNPTDTATVVFSGGENCSLFYAGTEHNMGTSFTIPARTDVILKIEPDDGYIPVFRDNLNIINALTSKFEPSKKEITINVAKNADCIITASAQMKPKEKLEYYSWDEINVISKGGVAPLVFDIYNPDKPELNCKKVYLKHQTDYIYQTVRIIDFDKDVDENGNSIGITFEFADLISDNNGYSLATQWNDMNSVQYSTDDYLNSSIRKSLTNEGGGHILWAQKNATKWSTSDYFKDKSVIDMLPNDLSKILKAPKKYVACRSGINWDDEIIQTNNIYDKLFLLTPREMGYKHNWQELDSHTSPYTYYKNCISETDVKRIKKQVKSKEISKTCEIIDKDSGQSYKSNVNNYAGYNFNDDANNGGIMWLRSPRKDNTYGCAWSVGYEGKLNVISPPIYSVYEDALAVAPAFCV